ncbi:hypothetical protein P4O66_021516 [Electrophorus voltai]|uniref:ribonuclease H n=1 Tax=Electrophorus voltai TaxID=2609070 RepID=A0AAD8ZP87_9TELE|nr:hypothetical protein P4O66_021516 [Electrophorus voltai]
MPFGLMNAPAVFQRYINEVLRDVLDRYVFIYLDNILIYSQTADNHVTHVRQVLQLLLESHLFIKPERSVFHAHAISFLGFVICHKLRMDPAKWESAPPSTDIPRAHVIEPIQWGVEKAVHQALLAEPDPGGGPPEQLYVPKADIVSDCGPQFTSWFWRLLSVVGAEANLFSGFRPQSNGQTKSVNQDLEHTLRCLATSCPSSWSEHLLWAEFAHNTLWHASIGMSPFECQFRYAPPMFPDQEADMDVQSAEQTVRLCCLAWRKARNAGLSYLLPLLKCFTPTRHAKDLPLHGYPRKLAPHYIGPFKVLRHVNPVSYRLALSPSLRVHPTFHVSRLRPVLCSVGPSDPPGLCMVDSVPAYTVKRVWDVRQVHGGVQHLVDWEGYRPEEQSWVPSRHIMHRELIRAFR